MRSWSRAGGGGRRRGRQSVAHGGVVVAAADLLMIGLDFLMIEGDNGHPLGKTFFFNTIDCK